MLTKQNMMTAAYSELAESLKFRADSCSAYVHAVDAIKYAAMALGAAQAPLFDTALVAESSKALELAKERLQAVVAAQIDAALAEDFDELACDAEREGREQDEQHPEW